MNRVDHRPLMPFLSLDSDLWELFHENSKITEFSNFPPNEYVIKEMEDIYDVLPYHGFPSFSLPTDVDEHWQEIERVFRNRRSKRSFTDEAIDLRRLSFILRSAYGVTLPKEETGSPRAFRSIPSAGGLYPLEIYAFINRCNALESGLYHFSPSQNSIEHLRKDISHDEICNIVSQSDVIEGASVIIFVTALFERSTFKYGNRGYRFALIEAGHLGQNVNLAAQAVDLGSVNIGGFRDHLADRALDLNGITHSTIYMIAVGS